MMTTNISSREPKLVLSWVCRRRFSHDAAIFLHPSATSYSNGLQLPQCCRRRPPPLFSFVTASIPRQSWRGSHDREARVQSRRGRRRIRGQAAGARHVLQPRVREAGLRLVPCASAGRATQGRGEQAKKVLRLPLAIAGNVLQYVTLFIRTLACCRCTYVGLHGDARVGRGNEIGFLHKEVQQYLDQFCTSSRWMHMNVLLETYVLVPCFVSQR